MRTYYDGAIKEVRRRGYHVPSFYDWRFFRFEKVNKNGVLVYGEYHDGYSEVSTISAYDPMDMRPGLARREGSFYRDELLDALDMLEDVAC